MAMGPLLRQYATLAQFTILERADRLLPGGRYCGRPLTDLEVTELTIGLRTVTE